MNKCFVIQPFNQKYDKRYQDVFKPAIESADYEAYRVDKDPSVEIPIEKINENIRTSFAVLADITEDNPNVWFEVGLAIAYEKKLVLICSQERNGKFPFDIQHHSIIRYSSESPSDFEILKNKIIEKLQAYSKIKSNYMVSESKTGILSNSIISEDAILLLGIIGKNMDSPSVCLEQWKVLQEFIETGLNQLAFNFAVKELINKNFLAENVCNDYENNTYVLYKLTEEGFDWMYENKSRFNLISSTKPIEKVDKSDYGNFPEDIPF